MKFDPSGVPQRLGPDYGVMGSWGGLVSQPGTNNHAMT